MRRLGEKGRAALTFWLIRLLLIGALRHDCGTKASTQVVRKFVQFGVAINLNGLARGIADHVAVVAPCEMVVKFSLGTGVQYAIKVVR
jgi:hypothetical protein